MKVKSLILILTFVLMMSLISGSVFAENPDEIVSINPAGFLLGSISINYEKVMDSGKSYLVGGGIFPGYSVYSVNAGLKNYKENNAPEGFYYGPVGSLVLSSDFVVGSIGGNAGFQWLLDDGFTLDLNAGVSVYMGDVSSEYDSAPFSGIGPTIGLNLGYAF